MSNEPETAGETGGDSENPVIQLLEATRALIQKGRAKPGALARDADNKPVDPNSDKAATYSLAGALQRAVWERHGDSTGLDSVHVYLGLGNLTGASMAGLDQLDDKKLEQRFDKALAGARGEAYEEPEEEDEEDDEEVPDAPHLPE